MTQVSTAERSWLNELLGLAQRDSRLLVCVQRSTEIGKPICCQLSKLNTLIDSCVVNSKPEGHRSEKGANKMIIRKSVAGHVIYNDGDLAEIELVGVEGVEKNLVLDTMQVSIYETTDTKEQFLRRFPADMWLNMTLTTGITPYRQQRKRARQKSEDRESGKR
jgi:hypothetical protein